MPALNAATYYLIALILRCSRVLRFVSNKINNVADLAQSELKYVAIGVTINCKL